MKDRVSTGTSTARHRYHRKDVQSVMLGQNRIAQMLRRILPAVGAVLVLGGGARVALAATTTTQATAPDPGAISTTASCGQVYCAGPTTNPVQNGPSALGPNPCAQNDATFAAYSTSTVTDACVTQFTSNDALGNTPSRLLSGTYTNIPAIPAGSVITSATLTVDVGAFVPSTTSLHLAVQAGCGGSDTDLFDPATDTAVSLAAGDLAVSLPATQALQQVIASTQCSSGDNGAPQGAYLAIVPTFRGTTTTTRGTLAYDDWGADLTVQSLTITYDVPPADVSVTPSTGTAEQSMLSWSAAGDSSRTRYIVDASIGGDGHDGTARQVYDGSATRFNSTDLACGEDVSYTVAAMDPNGQRTSWVRAPQFATTPCSAQAVTTGATTLGVSWPTSVIGPNYVVFWCVSDACSSPAEDVGTSGSYTVSGLVPNTEYTIWACTTTDTAFCPAASAWTDAAEPTDLTAVSSQTGITIAWAAGGNPLGSSYEVILADACGGSEAPLQWGDLSAPSQLRYAWSDLVPGTRYDVRVAARSNGSATTTAYDSVCGVETAPWPTIGTVTATAATTQDQTTLSWKSVSVRGVSSAPRYVMQAEVLRPSGTIATSPWSTIFTGTATSFTTTNQACGQAYLYRVQPEEVQTNWTRSLLWDTPPCPPTFTAIDGGLGWQPSGGQGYVVLHWPPMPGVAGYWVWVYDGQEYESFNVGDATSWDSQTADIFPSDNMLYPIVSKASQNPPILLHTGAGKNLRDRAQDLYCTVAKDSYCNGVTENYWITVSAYNAAGDSNITVANDDPCTALASDECYEPTLPLQTDPSAPTISTFQINGGAQDTYQAQVNLTLDASESPSGVAAYALSNDASNWTTVDLAGCTIHQVAACGTTWGSTVGWTLSPGSGSKTVYVRVESTAGVWSAVDTTSIQYIQDPDHLIVDAALDGGASSTTSTMVTMGVTVTDSGVVAPTFIMRASTNGGATWSAWADEGRGTSWVATQSIPGGASGERTVLVQVEDQYSNVGQGGTTIQYVNPNQPEAGAVTQGGMRACIWPVTGRSLAATCVVQPLVNVALDPPPGTVQMRASLDGVTWGSWEPVPDSIALNLGASPGLKTVWVQYQSSTGVVTAAVHHDPGYYVYDPGPLTVHAWWLANASATDPSGGATIQLQAFDPVGDTGLTVSVTENGATLYHGDFSASIPVTLSGSGYQLVQLTVTDEAGNTVSTQLGIYVLE